MSFTIAILWFFVGFVLSNGLKYLHISRASKKLQLKSSNKELSEDYFLKTAYLKSLPIIPLYYLLVWMLCSVFYFIMHKSANVYTEALFTGLFWWLLTLLLEMLLWVKTKHKLQLSWKEMYMKSQPWLSISYYAILISPLIISLML